MTQKGFAKTKNNKGCAFTLCIVSGSNGYSKLSEYCILFSQLVTLTSILRETTVCTFAWRSGFPIVVVTTFLIREFLLLWSMSTYGSGPKSLYHLHTPPAPAFGVLPRKKQEVYSSCTKFHTCLPKKSKHLVSWMSRGLQLLVFHLLVCEPTNSRALKSNYKGSGQNWGEDKSLQQDHDGQTPLFCSLRYPPI